MKTCLRRGCNLSAVPDRTISTQTFLEHACQHRHIPVDIVVDANFCLFWMKAVKPAGVLNQCSFPGYRQRQKQRVQTRIVEPFTNITSSSKYQPLLVIGNGSQGLTPSRQALSSVPPSAPCSHDVCVRDQRAVLARVRLPGAVTVPWSMPWSAGFPLGPEVPILG